MGCGESKPGRNTDLGKEIEKSINRKKPNNREKFSFRLVLAGPHNSGKTRFFKSYKNDPMNPYTEKDKNTNYTNLKDISLSRNFKIENTKVGLSLWDLAGDLKTSSVQMLTRNFFRDSDAVILLFDVTCDKSFTEMKDEWLPLINEILGFDKIYGIFHNLF